MASRRDAPAGQPACYFGLKLFLARFGAPSPPRGLLDGLPPLGLLSGLPNLFGGTNRLDGSAARALNGLSAAGFLSGRAASDPRSDGFSFFQTALAFGAFDVLNASGLGLVLAFGAAPGFRGLRSVL